MRCHSEASLLGLHIFSLCLRPVVPLCTTVPGSPLLKGRQSHWTKAHLCDLFYLIFSSKASLSKHGRAWKTLEGGARGATIVYLVSVLPFGSKNSPSRGSIPADRTVWVPQSKWSAGRTRNRELNGTTGFGTLRDHACFLRDSRLSTEAVRKRPRAPCPSLGDVPQSTPSSPRFYRPRSVGETPTYLVLWSWAPRRPRSFESCPPPPKKTVLLTKRPQNNV